MKINVEIDLTPDELRRFMGLPDVGGLQQQFLEQFTEGLQTSQDQREEFFRNVFAGAVQPWLRFFNPGLSAGTGAQRNRTDDTQESEKGEG